MGNKPGSIVDRSLAAARDKLLESVKTLYFPEIWYIIESFFATLAPPSGKPKTRRVLEVGHGIGYVGEAFAKSGWDVTLIDGSVDVLSMVKKRFDRAGYPIALEQAEADNLPFPNGSFDYLVCINTIEFMPDPNAVVREIARVLAPGGRAVVATFNALSPWGLPQVARWIRPVNDKRSVRFLFKNDFKRLFLNHKLSVNEIKDRAAYLPGTTRVSKLRLPLSGAHVALVSKPAQQEPSKI